MGLGNSLCYQRIADFFKKKKCEKTILGNEIRTPDKNKCLQTSNECNSKKRYKIRLSVVLTRYRLGLLVQAGIGIMILVERYNCHCSHSSVSIEQRVDIRR